MNRPAISDIYAGKIDAKEEVYSGGLNEFIESFVIPENCDIYRLINKDNCFITGFKGVGKTALLFYLDEITRQSDNSTCSSFIFFKEDYSETKKIEMEQLSKRILSFTTIDTDLRLSDDYDFEIIWKWMFFRRIILDNEDNSNGLFVNNENWISFKSKMNTVMKLSGSKRNFITSKIKFGIPITDIQRGITIAPGIEIDLNGNSDKSKCALENFVHIIEDAEESFKCVTRTDIPYYIFVDEMEAYMMMEQTFKRDLYLIRDLAVVINYFNRIFRSINIASGSKTKIIGSLRIEILNSISRFINSKEINKLISGYEFPLNWNYATTNSYRHPIFKILLKRIQIAYQRKNFSPPEDKDIFREWFPESTLGTSTVKYILDHGWNKPRDIVRLITVMQSTIYNENTVFSQAVFDNCKKAYSVDSLSEIREEMRAMYSPEDTDCIIRCLTGFKSIFSVSDIINRIERYYRGTILSVKVDTVLSDLYRVGVIGNFSPISKTYRWQHRGDDSIIIGEEWSIVIHYALQSALSVSKRHDDAMDRFEFMQSKILEWYEVTVTAIVPNYILVEFYEDNKKYKGSINISNISDRYVKSINEVAKVGDILRAQLIEYSNEHGNWKMSLKKVSSRIKR